jgi:transcriptional regulator with XRE-family HTH domain
MEDETQEWVWELLLKLLTSPHETIGERLKRLREAAGLSQDALARKTGTTRTHVYQIEHGLRERPRRSSIERYAAALDVSPDYLESGDADPDMEAARRSGAEPLEWLARHESQTPDSVLRSALKFLTYVHEHGDEVEKIIETNRHHLQPGQHESPEGH